ncbi:MAG: hypothetical protein Q7O66_11490, partial [Dehalococcoidia bacterium]|nr:hypothetical protein [Dehalococcoidia bacterium]
TLKGFLTPNNGSLGLRGIAINPISGHVFVTDEYRNLVHVFNAGDVSGGNWVNPIASLAVGGRPYYGIAVDSARGKVYVGNLADRSVSVINDPATGKTINLSRSGLSFGSSPGGVADSQTLSISNSGIGTLDWSLDVTTINGGGWLVPTTSSGTAPSVINVTVNPSPGGTPLGIGVYTGRLIFSSVGATNTPQNVDVTLTLTAGGTPSVATTIGTGGDGPIGIGIDGTRNLIYVAHIWGGTQCDPPCYGPNMVVKIDGNTLGVSNFSSNAQRPWGVAVDSADNKVIVVNQTTGNSNLSVLSGVDGSVNYINMGTDGYGAAFNDSTGKAYVASFDSMALYRVTIPGGFVKQIDLPGNGFGVALDPTRKRAYVAMFGTSGVAVVDTDSDTYLGTFTGDYTNLTSIAVNTANGDVFAVSRDLGTVTVKNSSGTLKGFLTPNNGSVGLRGIAINPISGHVFVTDEYRNLVHVFNAGDVSGENWVNPIASLAVGGRPYYGIAVDSDRGKVYVGNLADNTVTVINDPSAKIISLNKSSLAFVATPGGSANSQTFSISNIGAGTLNWAVAATTTSGGNWLVPTTTSGTAPSSITVGINTAPGGSPLGVGVYIGRLAVSSTGAANTPQNIDVRLSITTSIQSVYLPFVANSY